MSAITNRSRYSVTVNKRDDLTRVFSFSNKAGVKSYVEQLKRLGLEPKTARLDDCFLVRIREQGHKDISQTFPSLDEAHIFIGRIADERRRGLFADYSKSLKVTLGQLLVRFLLEEAPRQKGNGPTNQVTYLLEGWLEDSGPIGLELLAEYRQERVKRGLHSRKAKTKMRRPSTYPLRRTIAWNWYGPRFVMEAIAFSLKEKV